MGLKLSKKLEIQGKSLSVVEYYSSKHVYTKINNKEVIFFKKDNCNYLVDRHNEILIRKDIPKERIRKYSTIKENLINKQNIEVRTNIGRKIDVVEEGDSISIEVCMDTKVLESIKDTIYLDYYKSQNKFSYINIPINLGEIVLKSHMTIKENGNTIRMKSEVETITFHEDNYYDLNSCLTFKIV